ncbi:hypothetical protein GQ42DRAFT_163504 [Ramicandelaber brevisporus]|nr:hypothetical protein GQ42DRAFT_163504 [Ramicandelaber brevisporus]
MISEQFVQAAASTTSQYAAADLLDTSLDTSIAPVLQIASSESADDSNLKEAASVFKAVADLCRLGDEPRSKLTESSFIPALCSMLDRVSRFEDNTFEDSVFTQLRYQTLRALANTVIDSDANRSLFIEHESDVAESLSSIARLITESGVPDVHLLAYVCGAVFNLTNGHEVALKKMCETDFATHILAAIGVIQRQDKVFFKANGQMAPTAVHLASRCLFAMTTGSEEVVKKIALDRGGLLIAHLLTSQVRFLTSTIHLPGDDVVDEELRDARCDIADELLGVFEKITKQSDVACEQLVTANLFKPLAELMMKAADDPNSLDYRLDDLLEEDPGRSGDEQRVLVETLSRILIHIAGSGNNPSNLIKYPQILPLLLGMAQRANDIPSAPQRLSISAADSKRTVEYTPLHGRKPGPTAHILPLNHHIGRVGTFGIAQLACSESASLALCDNSEVVKAMCTVLANSQDGTCRYNASGFFRNLSIPAANKRILSDEYDLLAVLAMHLSVKFTPLVESVVAGIKHLTSSQQQQQQQQQQSKQRVLDEKDISPFKQLFFAKVPSSISVSPSSTEASSDIQPLTTPIELLLQVIKEFDEVVGVRCEAVRVICNVARFTVAAASNIDGTKEVLENVKSTYAVKFIEPLYSMLVQDGEKHPVLGHDAILGLSIYLEDSAVATELWRLALVSKNNEDATATTTTATTTSTTEIDPKLANILTRLMEIPKVFQATSVAFLGNALAFSLLLSSSVPDSGKHALCECFKSITIFQDGTVIEPALPEMLEANRLAIISFTQS